MKVAMAMRGVFLDTAVSTVSILDAVGAGSSEGPWCVIQYMKAQKARKMKTRGCARSERTSMIAAARRPLHYEYGLRCCDRGIQNEGMGCSEGHFPASWWCHTWNAEHGRERLS